MRRYSLLCVTLLLVCVQINCRLEANFTPQQITGLNITAALIPEPVCQFHLHPATTFWLSDKDWINIAILPPAVPNAAYTFEMMPMGNSHGPYLCTITLDQSGCTNAAGDFHAIIPTVPTPFSINILECPGQMASCGVLQIPGSSGASQPASFPFPWDGPRLGALQDKGFPIAAEDATYQIQPILDFHLGQVINGPTDGSVKVKAVAQGMFADFAQSLKNGGGAMDDWIWPDPTGYSFSDNFSPNLQVTAVSITDNANHDAPVPFCGVSTASNHDCGCNGDPSFATGPCTSVNVDNNCSNSRASSLTPTLLFSDPPHPSGADTSLSWEPIFSLCQAPVPDGSTRKLTIHFTVTSRANIAAQTAPVMCPQSP